MLYRVFIRLRFSVPSTWLTGGFTGVFGGVVVLNFKKNRFGLILN